MKCRIALITPGFAPEETAVWEGILAYSSAHDLDWEVDLVDPRRFPGPDRSVPADGLISWRTHAGDWERRLAAAALPRVLLAGSREVGPPPHEPVVIIGTDDEAVGHLAARHVREAGFAQAAIIAKGIGPVVERPHARRYAAFASECRRLDLTVTNLAEELPVHPDSDPPELQRAWIRAQRRRTCFFFAQDRGAAWFRQFCREGEIGVPDQIGIIGVDNIARVCVGSRPTLTSVDLPYHHLGRLAARRMHRLLTAGVAAAGSELVRPLRVVARESTRPRTASSPEIREALRLMRRRLSDPLDTARMAGDLGISRSTLWRRCVRELGVGPKAVQRRLRLERAEELLRESRRDLADIAAACGFASARSFGDAFRQRYGLPPGAYRRRCRGD